MIPLPMKQEKGWPGTVLLKRSTSFSKPAKLVHELKQQHNIKMWTYLQPPVGWLVKVEELFKSSPLT